MKDRETRPLTYEITVTRSAEIKKAFKLTVMINEHQYFL